MASNFAVRLLPHHNGCSSSNFSFAMIFAPMPAAELTRCFGESGRSGVPVAAGRSDTWHRIQWRAGQDHHPRISLCFRFARGQSRS